MSFNTLIMIIDCYICRYYLSTPIDWVFFCICMCAEIIMNRMKMPIEKIKAAVLSGDTKVNQSTT